MLDILFITLQVAFFLLCIFGLKLFLQGQGKHMGRND